MLPATDIVARLERPATPPRLARLRGFFEQLAEPAVNELMDRIGKQLHEKGAEITELAVPAAMNDIVQRHRTVMAVEAAAFHEPRLRQHPDDYLPNIRTLLEEGLACTASQYARCKEHQRELTLAMQACFRGVDALLVPATTGAAPDAATTGDPAFNSPWSYTGLPCVSLPAGRSREGLPLAVQLIGPHWSEAELFAAAAWCESVLEFPRRPPPV
jgi:aspartyl-tRNA(Asn)/glutamyl-tRNA(Gln) amidotransferase subunit A